MAPRISRIAFGVFFAFLYCQNVICTELHLVKKKVETVSPEKKSVIGNFDLKAYSRSIKGENCKNYKPKSHCLHMIRRTENACLVNHKYMTDNCRLACRFCSPFTRDQKTKMKKSCKDRHPKCRLWASSGDCLHYVGFMMDVCRKSCEICGYGYPGLNDKDERCPEWGKTGFCRIKKDKMEKLCPYSCRKYANRRYTVKYAKPPKRRSPRPTSRPKPTKPTPRPTPPLTEEEKEDQHEAFEEFAEEEETRFKEKEEQRKEREQDPPPTPEVTPIQAPPVLDAASNNPSPISAPDLTAAPVSAPVRAKVPAVAQAPFPTYEDSIVDLPSEYEGGTPPKKS